MKKALIVSTVSRQFTLFERGNIELLKSLGYDVHGAANYSDKTIEVEALGIKECHINIQRSPFNFKNLIAYKELISIMKKEKYDLIHCHAPMGGVLGRLAGKRAGVKNIIYTAHGFHFFKGAPLINWLLYFPMEWICSFFTDVIVTINQEDYYLAQNKLHMKHVYYVPGIGIELSRFRKRNIIKNSMREELGITSHNIVLLSIGELSKRKNHELAIRALSKINDINIHYLIVGRGKLEKDLKSLCVELGISNQVHFLGFRKDIEHLCFISDIFVFPSKQEGLPVSVMEAMASQLPIVATNIRGNRDLVIHEKGGYLVQDNNIDEIKNYIQILIDNEKLRTDMGYYNSKLVQEYKKDKVQEYMRKIYTNLKDESNYYE